MIELDHLSLASAHWSRQQYEGLLATNDPESPPSRFILVVVDAHETHGETISDAPHRMLAFLVARRIDDEWELENIVVAQEFRRRGLGTRLLREFIDHARGKNASAIFLEVRQSNQPARALYRQAGFLEMGSRRSYYGSPQEDAILYRLGFY